AVVLTVNRPGQPEPLSFTVMRRRLPNPSVEPGAVLADQHTGYLKITRFAASTYDEFKTELDGLRRKGMTRLPLVVLVDETSASAAEVLAGALQDHDRALLVGRRTFGKGLVQQPIALQDGGELRLTIARYYTPAGRCIQKPYGTDAAAYQHELAERQKRGELTSADSVPVAKELRFITDHGRAVYGGGGIVPDVFVARDTVLNSSYFMHLCRRGVLRAYA
nr:carboxyl-terminal-processing peptidase 3, chloroplastic isoform X1 [Tanacetum cinerariifolium]